MKILQTLRWRLMLAIGVSVTALWLLLAPWLLYGVRSEVQSSLDDRLAASAQMVASLMQRERAVAGRSPVYEHVRPEPPIASPEFPSALACRVNDLRGNVVALSQGAPEQALQTSADGYVNRESNGETWRVYTVTVGDLQITTGERLSTRDSLMASIVLAAALPFALALAGTLGLIWFGIRRGFRPLQRLSSTVAGRDLQDPAPLCWDGSPAEVEPLVSEINRLLSRMQQALERERRFTGDAAHELRTPLTAIKTQLQVARLTEAQRAQHALDQAERGVERLHSTLEQLLLLARLEGDAAFSDAGRAGADEISATALLEVQPKVKDKKLKLTVASECAAPIAVPAALAVAALCNLLDNAIRFAPPGSELVFSSMRDGQTCLWVIRDQGPGVDAALLHDLTGRFVHLEGTGSGLGLTIVDSIATHFGGSLVLSNVDPYGFEAQLRLPLEQDVHTVPEGSSMAGKYSAS